MELREKIAAVIFDTPMNPSDRTCRVVADLILALPELKEALAAKVELDALKLALLQQQLGKAA